MERIQAKVRTLCYACLYQFLVTFVGHGSVCLSFLMNTPLISQRLGKSQKQHYMACPYLISPKTWHSRPRMKLSQADGSVEPS